MWLVVRCDSPLRFRNGKDVCCMTGSERRNNGIICLFSIILCTPVHDEQSFERSLGSAEPITAFHWRRSFYPAQMYPSVSLGSSPASQPVSPLFGMSFSWEITSEDGSEGLIFLFYALLLCGTFLKYGLRRNNLSMVVIGMPWTEYWYEIKVICIERPTLFIEFYKPRQRNRNKRQKTIFIQ